MNITPLTSSIRRGCRQLAGRKIYIVMMVVVPALTVLFFLSLMREGLPLPVPVTVVDCDHSSLSRQVTRQLQANQYVDIIDEDLSYHQALDRVKSGESYGFFYIPRDFQKNAVNGTDASLVFYTNMSIFVPGTMSFKGFKTVAVVTSGGIVKNKMQMAGVDPAQMAGAVQPLNVNMVALHNPWLSYSIYLDPSFLSGVIALLTMLVASFSIGQETKRGTSVEWLDTAGGSMLVALVGKLLPQTVVFSAVGIATEAVLFRFMHFPMGNHAMHMVVGMILLVIACQALAVIFCEILPNLRLSMIMCSLTGILSFSICGFSFPVDQMYGGVGIFAYLIPLRYFFLIYIDQALNGIPIYYSRMYYIALCLFPVVSMLGLRRLRRHCLNPVYVP